MPSPSKKKVTKTTKKVAGKAVAKTTKKSAKKPPAKSDKKPIRKSAASKAALKMNELGIADIELASTSNDRKNRQRPAGEDSKAFVIEACQLMKDLRCENIIAYDVQGKSDVTDYIVIASGTSDRQMRSVSDDIVELGRKHQLQAFGKHIDGPTTWIVLDMVDAVIHLFEPQARAFYDLEMLWGDCPKLEWKR